MAPVFEIFLCNQSVEEGESVSFVCAYKGEPAPCIEWKFNGSPIEDGEIYHVIPEPGKTTLMIPEVYPEDAGTYTIRAYNKYGEAHCSSVLDVIGKFIIEQNTFSSVDAILYDFLLCQ